MLDHALAYAAEGIAVFPCKADKSPITTKGFKDATTNVEQITAWWSETPNALIGGAVPEGFIVIDVDPRNGGNETIKALRASGKQFPMTRRAQTGSGGWHFWFKWDAEPATIRSLLGEGVDVKRHSKGYVILPPSVSDTGPYLWLRDTEAVDAPLWMRQMLTKEVRDDRKTYTPGGTSRPPWLVATSYGDVALQGELETLSQAKPGTRNDELNKAAYNVFQLVHGGELDLTYARNELENASLDLGLSTREVQGTLDSAFSAAEATARTAPVSDDTTAHMTSARTEEQSFWTSWDVDEPEPPFYLYPLLPQNAYVLVYGATEAAKSMVWNALLAKASHHDIRSSVYSLENPPHVDRLRLRRLNPDPANFRLTNQPTDLGRWEMTEALVEREKAWGTNVILFDTYSHAFGSRSEDGNAKAVEFARVVRHIMHEVGCSVIVIDHTGYQQREEPRDASAKRQQVDVAILMEKEGSWVKGRNAHFSMTNFKSARFANPFENLRGAVADTSDNGLELKWSNEDIFGRWTA